MAGASALGAQQDRGMFRDAQAYERFMGRWSRLVAPLLVDFADIRDGGRVLDVGSGTGSLSVTIAERKPHSHVVGADVSKQYVAYASAQHRNDRVRFEVGDAQRLAFADAAFDAAFSLLVLNFVPDAPKALGEMRRVTRPSGRVVAAVWDYGEGMQMLRKFWDAVIATDPSAEKRDEKHMPLCRAGELRDLWNRGGLEHVEEQPLEVTMNFQSFEDYWSPFLLGQGPGRRLCKRVESEPPGSPARTSETPPATGRRNRSVRAAGESLGRARRCAELEAPYRSAGRIVSASVGTKSNGSTARRTQGSDNT